MRYGEPKAVVKRGKREIPLTPAWLAHRMNLSDKTPVKERARSVLRRQAEHSFHKWHDDCQKRKQRKEVMIAKGQAPKRGVPRPPRPPQRKLPCP